MADPPPTLEFWPAAHEIELEGLEEGMEGPLDWLAGLEGHQDGAEGPATLPAATLPPSPPSLPHGGGGSGQLALQAQGSNPLPLQASQPLLHAQLPGLPEMLGLAPAAPEAVSGVWRCGCAPAASALPVPASRRRTDQCCAGPEHPLAPAAARRFWEAAACKAAAYLRERRAPAPPPACTCRSWRTLRARRLALLPTCSSTRHSSCSSSSRWGCSSTPTTL